jgi:hypothetical protein
MATGILILAHANPPHANLGRVAEVALALARGGCRIVIHLDARVPQPEAAAFCARVAAHPQVRLVPRRACDWGTFSLVTAALDGVRLALAEWPDLTHLCQISGSCLPLRPVRLLRDFLAARPGTDFIESVPVQGQDWVVDGLSIERFTLRFPFSFTRQRRLFDAAVALQRRLRLKRALPAGLVPHIGSQWWCLSRPTLQAILADPDLPRLTRYFASTWIPDETFFQSLARRHSGGLNSRSLTFSRFDHQGKPFLFYDDHAGLLASQDAFFARKIWPGADALYRQFLDQDRQVPPPDRRLEARLDDALARRTLGRPGLIGPGRFTCRGFEAQFSTAAPYDVIEGIETLDPGFCTRAGKVLGWPIHGHLFAPGDARFAGGGMTGPGNVAGHARIRDRDPDQFLVRLVWGSQPDRLAFCLDPADCADIARFVARDPNAAILRLDDAWLLRLMQAGTLPPRAGAEALLAAERLRRAELSGPETRARVHRWSLDRVLADPVPAFREMAMRMGTDRSLMPPRLPSARDVSDFAARLRAAGLDLPLPGRAEAAA